MVGVIAFFAGSRGTMHFHAVAAVVWFMVGIFGLVQYILYLHGHPQAHAFSPIAGSIPILFFISIYANVAAHWSSYQATRAEVKQDES